MQEIRLRAEESTCRICSQSRIMTISYSIPACRKNECKCANEDKRDIERGNSNRNQSRKNETILHLEEMVCKTSVSMSQNRSFEKTRELKSETIKNKLRGVTISLRTGGQGRITPIYILTHHTHTQQQHQNARFRTFQLDDPGRTNGQTRPPVEFRVGN